MGGTGRAHMRAGRGVTESCTVWCRSSGVLRIISPDRISRQFSVCDSRRSQKLHVVSGCGWAKTSDRRGWFRGHAQTLVSMPLTATRHKAMARANKAGVCGMNVGGGWSVEECGADAGLF